MVPNPDDPNGAEIPLWYSTTNSADIPGTVQPWCGGSIAWGQGGIPEYVPSGIPGNIPTGGSMADVVAGAGNPTPSPPPLKNKASGGGYSVGDVLSLIGTGFKAGGETIVGALAAIYGTGKLISVTIETRGVGTPAALAEALALYNFAYSCIKQAARDISLGDLELPSKPLLPLGQPDWNLP